MPVSIPDSHVDLLTGPVTVTLVTIMPDGQPQATAVWCDLTDGHIRVNSEVKRQKSRNMMRDPRVSILAIDPENPLRWIEVRGMVVASLTAEEDDYAEEHIDELTRHYSDKDRYFGGWIDASQREVQTRVMFTIEPMRVNIYGH